MTLTGGVRAAATERSRTPRPRLQEGDIRVVDDRFGRRRCDDLDHPGLTLAQVYPLPPASTRSTLRASIRLWDPVQPRQKLNAIAGGHDHGRVTPRMRFSLGKQAQPAGRARQRLRSCGAASSTCRIIPEFPRHVPNHTTKACATGFWVRL
jgi:hypothetical protein